MITYRHLLESQDTAAMRCEQYRVEVKTRAMNERLKCTAVTLEGKRVEGWYIEQLFDQVLVSCIYDPSDDEFQHGGSYHGTIVHPESVCQSTGLKGFYQGDDVTCIVSRQSGTIEWNEAALTWFVGDTPLAYCQDPEVKGNKYDHLLKTSK